MKAKTEIKINPDGLETLAKEISDNISKSGLTVTCPECGEKSVIHSNEFQCPHCGNQVHF